MTHAGRHRAAEGGASNLSLKKITAALIQHECFVQEGRSKRRCWNMQRKKKNISILVSAFLYDGVCKRSAADASSRLMCL